MSELYICQKTLYILRFLNFFSFSKKVNIKQEKIHSKIYHSSRGKTNSWYINMIVDSLDHEYIFTLTCHFKVRKAVVIVNAIVLQ